jgi:formylglycine-generating enzyme required for sulfatase activity
MALTCPQLPELVKCLRRSIRTLLLVLVILAAAVAVACAKGEGAKPLNASVAAVSPEKEDGGSLLKGKGVTVNSDAIIQIFGVGLNTVNFIALLAVVIPAIGLVIYGIWALYKQNSPRWIAKSARKKQLADFAGRHKDTLREQIKKQSLSITAFDAVSVTLADTFVPLRLSETLRNEMRFMPDKSYNDQSNDGILSPKEVLRIASKKGYKKLLVIGEPGSGKTTLLYYYALLCLERKFYERHLPELVFYLPLRELKKDGEEYPLLPAILWASSEKQSHAIEEDVFSDWLHATTTLVLLDGLDEISDIAERRVVRDWIENAVASFPKAFFIVTSRTTGYRKVDKIELKHFVQVDILDFTVVQQKRFLYQWFDAAFLDAAAPFAHKTPAWKKSQREKAREKAEAIVAFLTAEEHKSLQSLAGIPLLLQLMAMLWKNRDYLPASRVELYREALHYILEYREPLLAAEQALDVLTPLSLWMQEELKKDEVARTEMHQQMQVQLDTLFNSLLASDFCRNLVDRAGVLVEYGVKEYLFRHKSFREYMAAVQLVKNIELLQVDLLDKKMNGAREYLGELAAHFGEAWWKEPICFFAAQANVVTFNAFLEQLFDSPVSHDFSQEQQDLLDRVMQEQQDLLDRVMQEGPKEEFEALSAKLLEPATTANRQRYLLKCMQTGQQPQAGAVVRKFIEQNLAQDDDIRRRAADFTVSGAEDRQGAPYVLIEGGSFVYSVRKKQRTVPDLHVARYPVTNQLYRRFIAYLDGNEAHFAPILPLEHYKEQLSAMAQGNRGFHRYLKGQENLAKLFRSRYDDDRKFNGADQPVVAVSWYAARAYCLWLSLLENNNSNTTLYRLPTEVEWEYAAGGKEGRRYPWGKEEPSSTRANYGKNEGATTPVGRYPEGVTPEGLYDMAGNMWEWMENRYGFGILSTIASVIVEILLIIKDKRIYLGSARALRGGSWDYFTDGLRCSARYGFHPADSFYGIGFRVVRSSHSSSS